jgi:hypothetical protein
MDATITADIITPVVQESGRREARLVIDQEHPFFFDHPLDHVSGTLLVTGLLDLLRAELVAVPRIRLSVKFVRICELDRPVALVAEQGAGAGWSLRGMQDGHVVCVGAADLLDGEPVALAESDVDPVPPMPKSLVHRANDANVVLGAPSVDPVWLDVPLVGPPAGHFLLRHGEHSYDPDELIEAGRQLATAAGHQCHGRLADDQLVWLGVAAEFPTAMDRRVPLELHWPVCPPHGSLSLFDFTLRTRGGYQQVGWLSYAIKSYPAAAYQRLRERGSRAS